MVLKLTSEQLEHIKKQDDIVSQFPNGSVKIVKENNRDVLIIDIPKLYNRSIISSMDVLEIIEQYESIGWKYYATAQPYLYFYKKKNFFAKLFKKIIDKS